MERIQPPENHGRHVFTDFPVAKLPSELRNGFKPDARVLVTIIEKRREDEPDWDAMELEDFIGIAPGVYPTPEEAVNAIRKARGE